ncbi:hypothetical protein [Arthrobacter castelli]|uniref:hypothetical protein n=1 Tax=Arthrobacter castelli TaxID=271431 RepID=UPI0004176230|nr:hypothetical protein [Arthrobacter castelli]
MCRPLAQGGRRCPYHSDPAIAALANAKTSVRRWDHKLNAAETNDDDTKMRHAIDKYGAALTRLNHREQACAGKHTASAAADDAARPPLPAPQRSKAGQYSQETVAAMSWDELADEYAALNHDPKAQERLEELIEDRDSAETGQVYRSSAETFSEDVQGTYDAVGWHDAGDELTNPTRRASRNLSKLEMAREEYDNYVYAQFDAAMEHTNGNFLNREGAAKGVDALSLFSGPVSRAKKYGSEELQAFFGMKGRHTLASFRYGLFQWRTDQKAAVSAKTEGFEDVAHV